MVRRRLGPDEADEVAEREGDVENVQAELRLLHARESGDGVSRRSDLEPGRIP